MSESTDLYDAILHDEGRVDTGERRERCALCKGEFELGETVRRFMRAEGAAVHERCAARARVGLGERERMIRVVLGLGGHVSRGQGTSPTTARLMFPPVTVILTWCGGPTWNVEARDPDGTLFEGRGTIPNARRFVDRVQRIVALRDTDVPPEAAE